MLPTVIPMTLSKIFPAIKRAIGGFWQTNRITNLFNNKQWHECIAVCSEVLKEDPKDFFGYYYRGLSNFELNLQDESYTDLTTALSVPLSKVSESAIREYRNYTKYKLGMLLRKQRKYEEAHEYLKKSIEEDSKYIFFYILKAEIFEDQNKTNEALLAVQDGLRSNPNNLDLQQHQQHLTYSYSIDRNEERRGA